MSIEGYVGRMRRLMAFCAVLRIFSPDEKRFEDPCGEPRKLATIRCLHGPEPHGSIALPIPLHVDTLVTVGSARGGPEPAVGGLGRTCKEVISLVLVEQMASGGLDSRRSP